MSILYPRPLLIKLMATLLSIVSFINCCFITDVGSKKTTPDGQIKVMTFNVRQYKADMFNEHMSAKRVPESINVILEELPDTLGVQESDFGWSCALNIGLAAEYKCIMVGRDAGGAIGESTSIFYRFKKFNLIDCGTFWLSQTPFIVSKGWDAGSNRTVTWAILQNKETKEKFVHINTHLDDRGEIARQKGTEMLLEFAAKFDLPVVCTGDFNLREGVALYKTLTSGCLKDSKYLATETMNGGTFSSYGPFDPNAKPIDYLLVSKGINVSKYHIITERDGIAYSDHFPVYIEISFE